MPRPPAVVAATWSLGLSCAIGVGVVATAVHQRSHVSWLNGGLALTVLLLVAFDVLSLYGLYRGRKWAWWLVMVLVVAEVCGTRGALARHHADVASFLIRYAMDVAGAVLLLLPLSRRWFWRPRVPPAGTGTALPPSATPPPLP